MGAAMAAPKLQPKVADRFAGIDSIYAAPAGPAPTAYADATLASKPTSSGPSFATGPADRFAGVDAPLPQGLPPVHPQRP